MQGDVTENYPLQRETLQMVCQAEEDINKAYTDHQLIYLLQPGDGTTEQEPTYCKIDTQTVTPNPLGKATSGSARRL